MVSCQKRPAIVMLEMPSHALHEIPDVAYGSSGMTIVVMPETPSHRHTGNEERVIRYLLTARCFRFQLSPRLVWNDVKGGSSGMTDFVMPETPSYRHTGNEERVIRYRSK